MLRRMSGNPSTGGGRRRRIKAAATTVTVAGLAAVLAACGSAGGSGGTVGGAKVAGGYGAVPSAASGTEKAGTISWAMQPGAVPNSIFPITTSATNSVFNSQSFQWEMWRPLYWTVNGVTPEIVPSMSLADAPVYSNGDKTVTIKMKSTYKWSDGQPLTAKDLEFDIDLIQAGVKESPSNWSSFTSGHFPDDLASMSTPDSSTLVLHLKDQVNPSWFTEDVLAYAGPTNPLPAHAWAKDSANGKTLDFTKPANAKKIFDFLTKQNKSVSTYTTNPLWKVVDGPYKLSQFNATTGGFTMTPNPAYGGPHAKVESKFQGVPFTSNTAELNALKTGAVDVGYVDYTAVPQVPAIKRNNYNVFGMPDFGSNFAAYNFKDKTGHFASIVNQLYFRQAMAHLQDQQGYIKAFMHGAGDPAYGTIPAYPKSPNEPANAAVNPYPFSVSSAESLLKAHGWTVKPGGTDTCAKPGSGSNECGAGIPKGTPLSFNFIYSTSPSLLGQQATDLTSKAKQAGIQIKLQSSNFNYMITNYIDPAAPSNENKWAMMCFGGETNNPYASSFGLFNTGGATQIGDYSNPTMDKLINASISGSDPSAVQKEAAFATSQQPVLFQPTPDLIWAWKNSISGQPASFENLSQYYATPEFWYFTK